MPKYRYSFAITLSFAFPNSDAPKDFDIGETGTQIRGAEKTFNTRFDGRKEISIFEIEEQDISMVLSTSYMPANVTREVSAFSQILVKEYQFDQYSAKSGRLFDATAQSLPEERPPSKEYDDEDAANAERADEERKEDEANNAISERYRLSMSTPSKLRFNTFVTISNEILGTSSIDRLEIYIKQLEDLTILAKSKRNIMIRSEEQI